MSEPESTEDVLVTWPVRDPAAPPAPLTSAEATARVLQLLDEIAEQLARAVLLLERAEEDRGRR